MDRNTPEISALRNRIELSLSRKINSPLEFEFLSDVISDATGEHLSPTTFKRMWGYIGDARPIRQSTLRILSNFLGFDTFEQFCESLNTEDEFQSEVFCTHMVTADELNVGDVVGVSWQPNRQCDFRYMGGMRFEVVRALNAKLQVGDTFDCCAFMKDKPLYVYNLVRGTSAPVSYVAGRHSGLTCVKVN